MCSRGVYQLKRIQLQFCDYGGSSKGVRALLESEQLQAFLKENPQIDFKVIMRRGFHPFAHSVYINGFIKDVPLRNYSEAEVLEKFQKVRDSFGRKALTKTGEGVYGVKKSVQGPWRANMWNNYPSHELERIRIPPTFSEKFTVETIQVRNYSEKDVRHEDMLTRLMKETVEYEEMLEVPDGL